MKKLPLLHLLLLFFVISCTERSPENIRERVSLEGQWQFQLDTGDVGVYKQWYLQELSDWIKLPGTTDSNQKGFLNQDTTTMHLSRLYTYEGTAWYQKKVAIPASFQDKHVEVFFERSKPSQVWIDDQLIGRSSLLQSPQRFDASAYLTPGEHTLTVRVDNSLDLTPYGNVHIYSDDTQTNWNGLLGELYLEASDKTHISNLQVYPNISQKKATIELEIAGATDSPAKIQLHITKNQDGVITRLPSKSFDLSLTSQLSLSYEFDEMALWDEYEQPLYQITVTILGTGFHDGQSTTFGMRDFSVAGTQFQINGRATFLRGKHEAAVFPLTGYVPMQVDEWVRVFQIAKTYGINHYRFHSYSPPEAAFIAADQEGIYLQAELPFWGGLESDTVAKMLRDEGYALLKAYANHPSFVMFSPGNEIWGGHDKVTENMVALKAYDERPLYTMGSNNNIGYMPPKTYAEFFVGARIPDRGDTTIGHARLTHAFADSWQGGILNTQKPSTQVNFSYAVEHMNLPIISHEIGQYQIYPNYDEIEKYTGNLKPWNLEVFKERLAAKGMADMDSMFQKASGAWSALCYKAEMEAAICTKGMAGFQLLDLQDFPGQGTALVGVLDTFMDSKGVITPEGWRQSCNDVVVLLEFPKYTWQNDETFTAKVVVANYSNKTLAQPVKWEIRNQAGIQVQSGVLEKQPLDMGGLNTAGEIAVDLNFVQAAEKLILSIWIDDTEYANSSPIWVYPATEATTSTEDLVIAFELTETVKNQLINGAKVLLMPTTESVKDKSFAGHFPPEFWNYGMFKGISEWVKKPVSPGTLGLLMDTNHPIFDNFPTDFHTNWQWFSIIKASNSLILDETSHEYRPIVQVIDNLERNHKLGMIFEFRIGEGKLLVCMSQLTNILDQPEAKQLYQSILTYMKSADFDPTHRMTIEELRPLL